MERLLARPLDAPHNRVAWLCVTFLYVITTNATTLALATIDFRFEALWLSNAGLLAALLLAPIRHRIELCLSALAAFMLSGIASGGPAVGTLVLSGCYVIEALIACILIERTPGGRIDLTRLRGLSHFLVACAGPAPMASGALWFIWQWVIGQPMTLQKAMQWQVSHGLGLIVVTPMILAAYSRIVIGRNLRGGEVLEALFHALALLVVSIAVFTQPYAVLYLVLPFICLASFRTGFLGSGLAVAVVAAVATTLTVLDFGPITHSSQDPEIRILLIQIFIACCVFTALPICVVLTDRNRLNHSLSASERRFRELAETAPIGIFTIAPDLRIAYANHELAQIAGRPVETLVTERFGEMLDPQTRAAIEAALLSCNTDHRLAEVSFGIHRDGADRWFQVHFAPMLDDDQRQVGWIGTVMDVTAHLAAQDELRIARDRAMSAVEARSRFLAVMSHEVRTPMTGVLATFELLARHSAQIEWPIPDMPRLISSTQSQARSLMTILNNVLDQAKLEAGRLELEAVEFDPAIVLADAIELFLAQAQAKGLALRFDEEGPGIVIGDPGRLHQIVANLLSNALKFTRDGSVDLFCQDCGDGYYQIRVKDTGIGIPEDAIGAIVEPFTQAETSINRRFGGTGLGLSIIRDLVEATGGTLEIESAVGVGSTFTVRLPKMPSAKGATAIEPHAPPPETAGEALLPPPAVPSAPSPVCEAPGDLQRLRILVVDDTDATRLAAQAQLHVLGHDPVGAANGMEGIALMLEQAFDLLLVDSAMPDLDGAATIRLLRLLPHPRGDVPVLGFTAYSQGELQQDLLDAGACGIVVKPFSASTLRDAIAMAIASRDAALPRPFALDDALAGYPDAMRRNLLAHLLQDLARLKAEISGADRARAIHSLKGIAGTFGLNELERICRFYESRPDDERLDRLSLPLLLDCTERAHIEVARLDLPAE